MKRLSSSPDASTRFSDEAALLAGLWAGRADAFETLLWTHGGRVKAVIARLLGNAADVDDAVQDAFLSAFKSVGRFEGRSSLGTWLHRIAVNAALMKRRSRPPAREEEDLEALMPRFVPSGQFARAQAAWGAPPEEAAMRREDAESVRAAIDRLPRKFRIPLVLRDIEGMSNEEVAGALGVSINAAKIRTHRARQALRSLLEARFVDRP